MATPLKRVDIQGRNWDNVAASESQEVAAPLKKVDIQGRNWDNVAASESQEVAAPLKRVDIQGRNWDNTASEPSEAAAPLKKVDIQARNWDNVASSESQEVAAPLKRVDIQGQSWGGESSPAGEPSLKKVDIQARTWEPVKATETAESSLKKVDIDTPTWTPSVTPDPEQNVQKPQIIAENWESLGVMAPKSIREFKGLNTLDPFSISSAYSPNNKNITSDGYPGLKTRPGVISMGRAGGALGKLVAYMEKELHYISGSDWSRRVNGNWQKVATNANAQKPITACHFQGNYDSMNMIVSDGGTVRRWDGSTVHTIASAPAGLNLLDQHDNRLYGAVKNTVHYTAIRKAEDWTTKDEAGTIVVETNDGEEISCLLAGSSHLLVFKPNSMFELWGNGPSSYTLQQITSDIGTISDRTVVTLEGVPYFLSEKGLYTYGGSRPRKDFAIPIQGFLDRLSAIGKAHAAVGTDGRKLYVSLPMDDEYYPSSTFEYDPKFGTWYVWKDERILSLGVFDNTLHFADPDGSIWKLGETQKSSGGLVEYSWESIPFGGGSLAQRQQWYRMWYVATIPAGSSMNVFLSRSAAGDSDWVLVKSITADGLTSGRIIIPVETVANANWVRVKFQGFGPVEIDELDYQTREMPMY